MTTSVTYQDVEDWNNQCSRPCSSSFLRSVFSQSCRGWQVLAQLPTEAEVSVVWVVQHYTMRQQRHFQSGSTALILTGRAALSCVHVDCLRTLGFCLAAELMVRCWECTRWWSRAAEAPPEGDEIPVGRGNASQRHVQIVLHSTKTKLCAELRNPRPRGSIQEGCQIEHETGAFVVGW